MIGLFHETKLNLALCRDHNHSRLDGSRPTRSSWTAVYYHYQVKTPSRQMQDSHPDEPPPVRYVKTPSPDEALDTILQPHARPTSALASHPIPMQAKQSRARRPSKQTRQRVLKSNRPSPRAPVRPSAPGSHASRAALPRVTTDQGYSAYIPCVPLPPDLVQGMEEPRAKKAWTKMQRGDAVDVRRTRSPLYPDETKEKKNQTGLSFCQARHASRICRPFCCMQKTPSKRVRSEVGG